ncbi:U3 small nucleolar ribonucleoprotein IMP3 [Babesia caballi]|uniref:U3 small nucleolar ribonucleoprotein IMP3 n=1 Tax=Babesia caballi TaxID=5871 RepID=A0AAV4M251_BABCB|nr:U3 small nucleolar ribonucleoprotein IMP3 [Babesia caballi]
MITLTRIAFLRRHSDNFEALKRQLQKGYLNQSRHKVRHRDELLNEIESMEINAVFERVTGAKLDGPARESESAGDYTDTGSAAKGAQNSAGPYDFKNVRQEFERLGNFESLSSKRGGLQDLTHQERQELQRFEARARLADPAGIANKNRAKADPRRDAKQIVNQMERGDLLGDLVGDDPRGAAMVGENRFDEIVSRIRAQMRLEKQESSKVNKARVPNFNGVIVDPIAKHVRRRRLRINAMIKDQLEQIITANDPSLILGELKGASISLKRVEMTSGKATIRCYYTLLGAEGNEEYVQGMLQRAQKRVRFCLARKLELGYTPPVVFIRANDADLAHVKMASRAPEHAFNRPLDAAVEGLAERFHKTMVAF